MIRNVAVAMGAFSQRWLLARCPVSLQRAQTARSKNFIISVTSTVAVAATATSEVEVTVRTQRALHNAIDWWIYTVSHQYTALTHLPVGLSAAWPPPNP